MKNKTYIFFNTLFLIIVIGLTSGCDKSTAGGNNPILTPTNSFKGVFVDSQVQGLIYNCGNTRKLTDSSGAFECALNTKVTFYIGRMGANNLVKIGEVNGSSSSTTKLAVTPQMLAGKKNTDITDADLNSSSKTMFIAQLLQSLDRDNNTSNGIQIVQEVAESFATYVGTKSLATKDIDSIIKKDLNISAIIDGVNNELNSTSIVKLTVVTIENARIHLKVNTADPKLRIFENRAVASLNFNYENQAFINKMYKGTFLNAGVGIKGIKYNCGSGEKLTEDNGKFGPCSPSKRISFKLGTVHLGVLEASDILDLIKESNSTSVASQSSEGNSTTARTAALHSIVVTPQDLAFSQEDNDPKTQQLTRIIDSVSQNRIVQTTRTDDLTSIREYVNDSSLAPTLAWGLTILTYSHISTANKDSVRTPIITALEAVVSTLNTTNSTATANIREYIDKNITKELRNLNNDREPSKNALKLAKVQQHIAIVQQKIAALQISDATNLTTYTRIRDIDLENIRGSINQLRNSGLFYNRRDPVIMTNIAIIVTIVTNDGTDLDDEIKEIKDKLTITTGATGGSNGNGTDGSRD